MADAGLGVESADAKTEGEAPPSTALAANAGVASASFKRADVGIYGAGLGGGNDHGGGSGDVRVGGFHTLSRESFETSCRREGEHSASCSGMMKDGGIIWSASAPSRSRHDQAIAHCTHYSRACSNRRHSYGHQSTQSERHARD
jgi:hypothetical protein